MLKVELRTIYSQLCQDDMPMVRRILYAAEEDPSIVEEAQAMLLNQEKQLSPIYEDAEEYKLFEMAFFQLLSN